MTFEAAEAPWFRLWFDSPHYHRLYSNRDDAEAARFVEALLERLRPESGSAMLDLGCGAGRHARCLAAKGFDVTGLDLASGSIETAKTFEHRRLRFFEHDMRAPFGEETYDYVFSFFTSFGYFDDLAEHWTVVRNISDSLKDDGCLVLDYLNVGPAESLPARRERKEIDGVFYHLTRWADRSHLFKRIVVDEAAAEPVEHVERVAKLSLADFELLFALNRLRLEEVYGDYQLGAYDAGESPRMILVARKEATSALSGDAAIDALLQPLS